MKSPHNETTNRWEGKYYKSHSDWQFHFASVALKYIQLPSDARVLDIGCGDGRFTQHMANLVSSGTVVGLDSSPLMLSVANSIITPNLSFILGDATKLPSDRQFEYVTSFNCLHWVIEIKTALEQIRNILSPGGKTLILIAPTQVKHPIHEIIIKVIKDRWSSYFTNISNIFPFHTVAKWATLIESSGMIPEHLHLIDASLDYADEKTFADWVAGWVPCGAISKEDKGKFVQDVVRAYISRIPCSKSGVVHYGMDELVIVASKPLT